MVKKQKNAYLIFIDDSKGGIDDATLSDVENKISESKADHLFLIIQSGGGSPFSAVSIMNILDAHFGKISTIVPRYAKSAATLMALGTDEIYLDSKSALGPLDLPIEHHRDGSRISALDVRNTATSMAALAESIAKSRFKFFREREVSTLDAARFSLESATSFLEPIMEQVDPYHLQKAERELRIGLRYATKMLSRRMMRDKLEIARETARCLVDDFPAYEYSIYSDDARNLLKLEIKKIEDLGIWKNTLKQKYDKVSGRTFYIEYGIIETNADNTTKK
jgi:hypothetical protein